MRASFASLLFVGCSVVATVACSKDEDKKKPSPIADLGEPIGADVPAKGDVPAISLALAVSKGQDPVTLLPHVVSAVATAVNGCPDFVREDKDVTAVTFSLENGKMKVPPRDESPGTKCLAAALNGKDGGPAGSNVPSARVEIKLPPAPAKAP